MIFLETQQKNIFKIMADFNIAYKKTGGWEGGWNIVKGDRGGETYKGIARNFFPKWEGWKIVDAKKPLRHNQIIKDETLDKMVHDFYKKTFWDVVGGDQIEDQSIANTLYDFGVNTGQPRSIKNIQKVLGLKQTGKITQELIKRANNPENYLI